MSRFMFSIGEMPIIFIVEEKNVNCKKSFLKKKSFAIRKRKLKGESGQAPKKVKLLLLL